MRGFVLRAAIVAAVVFSGRPPALGETAAAPETGKEAIGHERRMLGAFTEGFKPDAAKAFEEWLGRKLDFAVVFGGQDNGWHDFVGSVWATKNAWPPTRKLLWSQPLIAKDWKSPKPIASLRDAASGAYDKDWQEVLDHIGGHDPNAIVRLGWEFNGDWYPWRAAADEKGYVDAFRHFVQLARAKHPNFKFMWCPNVGSPESDPERAYPGDDVVDIIGMDVYEKSQWDKGTPDQRWQNILTRQGRGLDWLASFAAQHRKPIAVPEWASDYDDGEFIRRMHDWMAAHNVVMQSYWDSDSSFSGSFKSHPKNGAVYKELFRDW